MNLGWDIHAYICTVFPFIAAIFLAKDWLMNIFPITIQIILWLGSNWRTELAQQCGLTKLNHLTSHLNNVETCVINMITQNLYFDFYQTFQPINVCVMTFTETELSQTSKSNRNWSQEAVNMAAPCLKLLWGWYVSGFRLMEEQECAKINVKGTRDV